MAPPGAMVISLDLELYWGVRDVMSLEAYRENLVGERRVVPLLLDLFAEFGIQATWAAVGFLYFQTRDELVRHLPTKRPQYEEKRFSPYPYVDSIGPDEDQDPFHFAPSMLELIRAAPGQEIATHTFSHYYTLEVGQDAEAFRADVDCALLSARARGDTLESIVFPRNQVNPAYLPICAELGLKAYRGTERSWIYRTGRKSEHSLARRAVRLLDAFLPLSSHNAYPRHRSDADPLVNVPSSRFLRPYSSRLRVLEPLRLRRIRSDVTYAARHGLLYHLWWHPHNFGVETERNLDGLRRLLEHFAALRERYGMESLNMSEFAQGAREP